MENGRQEQSMSSRRAKPLSAENNVETPARLCIVDPNYTRNLCARLHCLASSWVVGAGHLVVLRRTIEAAMKLSNTPCLGKLDLAAAACPETGQQLKDLLLPDVFSLTSTGTLTSA